MMKRFFLIGLLGNFCYGCTWLTNLCCGSSNKNDVPNQVIAEPEPEIITPVTDPAAERPVTPDLLQTSQGNAQQPIRTLPEDLSGHAPAPVPVAEPQEPRQDQPRLSPRLEGPVVAQNPLETQLQPLPQIIGSTLVFPDKTFFGRLTKHPLEIQNLDLDINALELPTDGRIRFVRLDEDRSVGLFAKRSEDGTITLLVEKNPSDLSEGFKILSHQTTTESIKDSIEKAKKAYRAFFETEVSKLVAEFSVSSDLPENPKPLEGIGAIYYQSPNLTNIEDLKKALEASEKQLIIQKRMLLLKKPTDLNQLQPTQVPDKGLVLILDGEFKNSYITKIGGNLYYLQPHFSLDRNEQEKLQLGQGKLEFRYHDGPYDAINLNNLIKNHLGTFKESPEAEEDAQELVTEAQRYIKCDPISSLFDRIITTPIIRSNPLQLQIPDDGQVYLINITVGNPITINIMSIKPNWINTIPDALFARRMPGTANIEFLAFKNTSDPAQGFEVINNIPGMDVIQSCIISFKDYCAKQMAGLVNTFILDTSLPAGAQELTDVKVKFKSREINNIDDLKKAARDLYNPETKSFTVDPHETHITPRNIEEKKFILTWLNNQPTFIIKINGKLYILDFELNFECTPDGQDKSTNLTFKCATRRVTSQDDFSQLVRMAADLGKSVGTASERNQPKKRGLHNLSGRV